MITTEQSGVTAVRGEIPLDRDPARLDQDILEVQLDSGVFIDVGWYPEHDLSGEFVIRVYRDSWENQLLDGPIRAADANEAVKFVEQLVNRFSAALLDDSTGGG